jgi:hypothetical protein
LYVGDSLGVGTTPGLAKLLGASASVQGDSKVSRPSPVGLTILRQLYTPADDVVIFDLGTNDDAAQPRQLAADLAAARQATGTSCLIVATLNRPPFNGVPVDGLNSAVEQFAAVTPNVQLVDWHAEAQADPGLLVADQVHPTPDGYALRAQLFAEAVTECAATSSAPAPRPQRARKRARAKPKRRIKVPGIESSGISFSEPLRVNGKAAQLLLPNTQPPYPAVVTVGARDAEAEALASAGVAALEFTTPATDADIRAAVALLRGRKEVERDRVALWGVGTAAEAMARAAAAGGIRALVAIAPVTLPAVEVRDWRIRRELGTSSSPVTKWLRMRARSDSALRQDPAAEWERVTQPLLATWITGDAVPNRESAKALADSLARSRNQDRTFTTAADRAAAVTAAVRWLKRKLIGDAKAAVATPLPPRSKGVQPVEITSASALYGPPVQIAWLALPAIALIAFALRSRRDAIAAASAPDAALPPGDAMARAFTAAICVAAVACAASIAGGIAAVLDSDGSGVAKVAGLPWPFALAFVFAAMLAIDTAVLAWRRALVPAAAGFVWLTLALFWLL